MDGIALEIWNKKLLLSRQKRQQAYKECVELSVSRGYYSSNRLPALIYDAAAESQLPPGIHVIDMVQPPGMGIPTIADMDPHQTTVAAALAAKSSAETPRKARWEVRFESMGREPSRPPTAPITDMGRAQRLPYMSWWRHQMPVSLRPLGARSSHWNMPQRPSRPRA